MATRLINLTGGSPWGFTLSGGKEFGAHLKISKVTAGGKAAKGGVKEGEYLIAINGDSTEGLLHVDAQQMIKATGMSLQLKLSVDPPKSPVIQPKMAHDEPVQPQTQQSGGRPRPPPPPQAPTTTGSPKPPSATTGSPRPPSATTGSPKPPPATYTSATYRTTAAVPTKPVTSEPPPQKSQLVTSEPPPQKSQLVPDSGLDSGSSSLQQSPAFKRITIDSRPTPSVLSPREELPPSERIRNITFEDTNVKKYSHKPPPPPNVPSKVTTTTVKVPKKEPPIAKPAPPPTAGGPPPSPGKTEPEKIVDRQGVCTACNEPIRGPFASAMNRVWHPEHFTCTSCKKQLQNTTFIFEDEKIYCDDCYGKNVAPSCFSCHRPIMGSAISALGLHWHQEHFTCSQCKCDLTQGEGFNMESGRLFCGDCYSAVYGATCYGCSKKIGGDELWVEALNHTWHSHCFICESCKSPLEGSTFFAKLGRPYCRNCA